MGSIKTFDISNIIKDFNLSIFIESGTHLGDGVNDAIQYEFETLYSVECLQDSFNSAKNRFKDNENVKLYCGYSKDKLPEIIKDVPDNKFILFWLDAHLPCYYSKTDPTEFQEQLRFPLQDQLSIIKNLRLGRDVIIIDDLGMYVEGDFQRQRFPEHLRSNSNKLIDTINKMFSETHDIKLLTTNSGYVLITPKDQI